MVHDKSFPEEDIDFSEFDDSLDFEEAPIPEEVVIPPVISFDEPEEKAEDTKVADTSHYEEELETLRTAAAVARQEAEEARTAAKEASKARLDGEKANVNAAIEYLMRDQKALTDNIVGVKTQIARAQAEGDLEKLNQLFSQEQSYAEKMQATIQHLNQAYSVKNSLDAKIIEEPVKTSAPKAVPDENREGNKWMQRNRDWYSDPDFKDKRDKADRLYDKLKGEGYSPASPKFWAHLDKKIAEEEKVPSSKPAVRTVASTNNGSQRMVSKQKADAALMNATYEAMRRMEKVDMRNPNTQEFLQERERVYRSLVGTMQREKLNQGKKKVN